jgi:hypothetical protein
VGVWYPYAASVPKVPGVGAYPPLIKRAMSSAFASASHAASCSPEVGGSSATAAAPTSRASLTRGRRGEASYRSSLKPSSCSQAEGAGSDATDAPVDALAEEEAAGWNTSENSSNAVASAGNMYGAACWIDWIAGAHRLLTISGGVNEFWVALFGLVVVTRVGCSSSGSRWRLDAVAPSAARDGALCTEAMIESISLAPG